MPPDAALPATPRDDMTPPAPAPGDGLAALLAAAAGTRGPPPVHLWNPTHCGDIDMRIARDGTWFHEGSPIGRPALVKLFASVLRHDPDGYVLVTPVEKCAVRVEDVPFLAVEMAVDATDSPTLVFRTNVDDIVRCGPDNPLRFDARDGTRIPYLHVRRDLWARLTRPVFYELVNRGETREIGGERLFGVASAGAFFAIAPEAELDTLA